MREGRGYKRYHKYCAEHDTIETLTLYAFSTENWKRPKYEVDFLMRLLDRWLEKELPNIP